MRSGGFAEALCHPVHQPAVPRQEIQPALSGFLRLLQHPGNKGKQNRAEHEHADAGLRLFGGAGKKRLRIGFFRDSQQFWRLFQQSAIIIQFAFLLRF